jgi:hypothetical protein
MTKRSAITVRSWMSRTTTSSAFASDAASARIRASVVGSIANPPFVPRLGKLLQLQYKRFTVYVQPLGSGISRLAQDSRAGLGLAHDAACCTTAIYAAVVWWAWKDLNLRPGDYESLALTPELQAHARIANDRLGQVYNALKVPTRRTVVLSTQGRYRACHPQCAG